MDGGSALPDLVPRKERVSWLSTLSQSELVHLCDRMMVLAGMLGEQLADIAELVGLDREAEDLAIPPRVRQLVTDLRVANVRAEFH